MNERKFYILFKVLLIY